MTRVPLKLADTRANLTGINIVAAIRKCELTREQCEDLKKVIIFPLGKELRGELKIPVMSIKDVKLLMIVYRKSRKHLAKNLRLKANAKARKSVKNI